MKSWPNLEQVLLVAIVVFAVAWFGYQTKTQVEDLQKQVDSLQKSEIHDSQEANRQYREQNPGLFKESVLRKLDSDLNYKEVGDGGTFFPPLVEQPAEFDVRVKEYYSRDTTRDALWINLVTLVHWYRQGVADKEEVASRCAIVGQLTDQYFTAPTYQTLNYYWSYRVAQLCFNVPGGKTLI